MTLSSHYGDPDKAGSNACNDVGQKVEEIRQSDLESATKPSECEDERMMTTAEITQIFQATHGDSICRLADILKLTAVAIFLVVVIFALQTQTENILLLGKTIRDLGWLGPIIFFLVFLWVGLPIGYSWSAVVILVGFAYGWWGILYSNLSTMASVVFGHHVSKRCFSSWVDRKVERLSLKHRRYFRATRQVMKSGRSRMLMQLLLRQNPLFSFGITNAILSILAELSNVELCIGVLIGNQYYTCVFTALGVMFRDLGSYEEAMQSSEGQTLVTVQITCLCVLFICVFFFVRYLKVKMLPGMLASEAVRIERVAKPEEKTRDNRDSTSSQEAQEATPPTPTSIQTLVSL